MKNFIFNNYSTTLLLIVFAITATAYGQQVNIVATPQTSSLSVGQTTTILIQAEAGTQEVNTVQLVIEFNNTELEVVDGQVTPGTALTGGESINRVIKVPDNSSNVSHIQFSDTAGTNNSISGTFDIFTMEVKALKETTLSEFKYILINNPSTKVVFGPDEELLGTTTPIGITITQDSTPPTITLLGPNPVELNLNEPYVEEGATAVDNVDGAITDITIDDSEVDINTIGEYSVYYEVTDAAGNIGTESRTVSVTTTLTNDLYRSKTALRLYPNPVSDVLFIQSPETSTISTITIYTIDGRIIEKLDNLNKGNELKINVSSYAAGTYLFVTEIDEQKTFKQFNVK